MILKPKRRKSNWKHEDSWFFDRCLAYERRREQPPEFVQEVYDIIDAVLVQLNVSQSRGYAVCQEYRQDCALRIFSYAIPRMVANSGNAKAINAHSYLYMSAYYKVLQNYECRKRRERIRMDWELLTEILGHMVYDDNGELTATKESYDEDGTEAEELDHVG